MLGFILHLTANRLNEACRKMWGGKNLTFCSYPKGGTFTTKLDLKN
jgi:hypothetical protein